MFRRLFLVFLVFLGMATQVWAEGIIPLISANEEFKEWKSKDYVKEYQWDVNTPFNLTDFREKNPCKVYRISPDYIKEYQWDVNTPFNMTDFREKNPCKVYSISPDYIKEYQWDVNTPFNMTDFREKNPCKVYSPLSFGYLISGMMPLASSHY